VRDLKGQWNRWCSHSAGATLEAVHWQARMLRQSLENFLLSLGLYRRSSRHMADAATGRALKNPKSNAAS
jgi:hypothetical protein